jgi:hypothetical protein
MNAPLKPTHMGFDEIRRNFDAAYSYLLFEKTSDPEDRAGFDKIGTFLSRHRKGFHKQHLFYDKGEKKLMLVVELAPKQKENLIKGLSSLSLSKDITFYTYDFP